MKEISLGVQHFNPPENTIPILAIYMNENVDISIILNKTALENGITNQMVYEFLQGSADQYKAVVEQEKQKVK